MPTKTPELLICRESFVGTFDDNSVYVGVEGKSILDPSTTEGAKVLRNWGKFFTPITENYPRPIVEQATAAPGEKRAS